MQHLSTDLSHVRRTSSVIPPDEDEDEDIEIKPSSELIPDEYEHSTNENIAVHIFHTSKKADVSNAETFRNTLIEIGYKIEDDNIHNLQDGEAHTTVLSKIHDDVSKSARDGLILFYSGVTDGEDANQLFFSNEDKPVVLSEVWKKFCVANCPELRNKPKIFIFQASKFDKHQTDVAHDDVASYDTPSEADILIIYNKTDAGSDSREFSNQVCRNIERSGRSEDIISLITNTENRDKSRPVVISTLTSKFYFNLNDTRGHHHDIIERHDQLSQVLKNLQQTLNATDEALSTKSKSRLFHKAGLAMASFRVKNDHQTQVETKKSKTDTERTQEGTRKNQAEGKPEGTKKSKVATDGKKETAKKSAVNKRTEGSASASTSTQPKQRNNTIRKISKSSNTSDRPAWKW